MGLLRHRGPGLSRLAMWILRIVSGNFWRTHHEREVKMEIFQFLAKPAEIGGRPVAIFGSKFGVIE